MRLLIKPLFFLIFICINYQVKSQEINPKWGKVSKEELEMSTCSFDSTADAMVLSKTGYLRFNYNNDKGWQYEIDIVKRVKILSAEGHSHANISLTTYEPTSGSNKEEILGLRAITYNLVGDKIEKTKLENKDIYETRLNDYRVETAFAMPNVNDGAVIEYKFQIQSDYISNLYEWHFQEEIPVGFVEYRLTIPEFFDYNHSFVGAVLSIEKTKEKRNESFTYTYTHTEPGMAPVQRKSSISSVSEHQVISTKNIPSLDNEPMMNNRSDQISRIESQLVGVKMPGRAYKPMATSYDDFTTNILSWQGFGGNLDKGSFAKDQIALTISSNQQEQLRSLYSWIRKEITFNNGYGFTSDNANKKLFREGEGTVADINLTLVSVLREAGIESYPVLLSTRGHGVPHPVYPNYEEFNYVIAAAYIDGAVILADATSNLPAGVLPVRCLNGKGWVVKPTGGNWIDLKSDNVETYIVQNDFNVSDGVIDRKTGVKLEDYARYIEYGKYLENKEEYQQEIANSIGVGNSEVEVIEEDGLRISIESQANVESDIIYINPFDFGPVMENPYKRNERFSNIDYPFGASYKVITNIDVPESYSIEIPENIAIGLPNNGGKFIYSSQRIGNRITILSQFTLTQTSFSANEYPALKQFYQIMVNKNTEPVVLKKM